MALKKIIIIIALASVLMAVLYTYISAQSELCLYNGYRIKSLSGEFQSVTKEVYLNNNILHNRKIRGLIEGFDIIGENGVLVGVLDITVLQNNDLSLLLEPEDKNGFFVLDMREDKLLTGMTKNEFNEYIFSYYGEIDDINIQPIKFLDKVMWSCILK